MDMKLFEIADMDADTDIQVFDTADTDADTDMNFLKNRGHGHGADKPRTCVSTDLWSGCYTTSIKLILYFMLFAFVYSFGWTSFEATSSKFIRRKRQ